ncbi:uncharacterized protein RAG0_12840 [Rhynchosporium agropyri]|uniref:Uncharacterized protein n=1 Tax=Rhynchosporium agropyri TaxID=914238 RepID=A0A1E1L9V4_9HELO|nr:uncharacterized protein RAG0_12840 [Rhynchosporium agropyri]
MCIGVPPRTKCHRPKSPKTRQHSNISPGIHCPFQATFSKNFPSSSLPAHFISSRVQNLSSKHNHSQPQTISFVPWYATPSPPWEPSQPGAWAQCTQPAGNTPRPSTPVNTSVQQTNSSQNHNQSQKQNSSFLNWQAAKDEALADQIEVQKAAQKAATRKRENRRFYEEFEEKLVFSDNLRKRFGPTTSASKVSEKERDYPRKESEELRKANEKSRQQEEKLLRYKEEAEEREREVRLQKMLDGVRGPILGKVEKLDQSLRACERRAEIAAARNEGKFEGIKEEQEKHRVGRARERRYEIRSQSSDSERSRSRSKYRSTMGRQLQNAPDYTNGYAIGYSTGFGNAMSNPINYQLGAPIARSNSPRSHGCANQPLVQSSPNSNTYWNNQAVPCTNAGTYSSSNLLRESQFQNTAREISGLDFFGKESSGT